MVGIYFTYTSSLFIEVVLLAVFFFFVVVVRLCVCLGVVWFLAAFGMEKGVGMPRGKAVMQQITKCK
jgi:hypothetical protein